MTTRTLRLALAAVAFLGVAAPAAHAWPYQHYYTCFGYCPSPQPHYMCYGYCPNPRPNPYPYYTCYGYCPGYYGPYYPGYYAGPYQGYLSGAADVINSQGKYM